MAEGTLMATLLLPLSNSDSLICYMLNRKINYKCNFKKILMGTKFMLANFYVFLT